jgi:Putative heavy-metal-binding
MWREARARGANAVVAMRFDCNEIGDIMSEVAAYGTAVTIEAIQPPLPRTTPDREWAGQGRHGQAPSLTGDRAATNS